MLLWRERSLQFTGKTPTPARQLPITGSAHKAGNGRRPLPAATGIARSVRPRRRGDGSQTARRSCCRFPTSTSSSPCRRDRRHRLPEQARRLRPPVHGPRPRRLTRHRRRSEAPGRRIGITAVLHTWGSALTHHPHVHMIVPGGGLSPDGSRWVACRSNFLVHVNLLARLFSGKMLAMLADAHDAGQLTFFNAQAGLADKTTFKRFIAPLRRIKWVVYCKAPFAGPKQVLRYLSRYTHRVAISNRRLIAADDAGVAFRWKDYRIDGPDRWKTMRLHPHEFIRRFLLHVLPRGFHRIRHMWTASWQAVFDALIALVGCGHMSGLLVRYRTAGPDDIRQSWSLSLRRARSSWRMSGCPGLSLRPCRSSRRCACQSLRN